MIINENWKNSIRMLVDFLETQLEEQLPNQIFQGKDGTRNLSKISFDLKTIKEGFQDKLESLDNKV